ncbi:glutathione S-transferase [Roseateles puraquae]|uniref:Glutathione S-transferase n=1 Tax=Roseateles puraquae TaxID=431059 RepID=A0A254N7G6_9BURK|nr:glutathione S-transferase [Roseateles puraquae]MDG0856561.1 glutathione S-transferase [Roseateles puraquae]OWR03951.1 glutathione S-transferase [Roseateles puraquae]
MKLIGMLDSPYVRRVALSLRLLDLPFEHASISVFRGFDRFRQLNPVVKAPTLVCDDGTLLMDSSLMLQYAEVLAGRSLLPSAPAALAHELHLIGLALAACEKTAQIVYERGLRPAEKHHAPWIERVTGQLQAAYAGLETALSHGALPPAAALTEAGLGQASLTTAVAWTFTQFMLPEVVDASAFPALVSHAAAAEALPVFRAIPCDDAVELR